MATDFVKVTMELTDLARLRDQAERENCSVAHLLRRGVGAADPQIGGVRANGRRPGRPRKNEAKGVTQ